MDEATKAEKIEEIKAQAAKIKAQMQSAATEDKKEEIKKRQQESEFRISMIRTELFTIVVLVYYY